MTTTTIFNIPSVETGIHHLAATYPDWWMEYEDANLDWPRTPAWVALQLLETAPTAFSVGLVAGRVLGIPIV